MQLGSCIKIKEITVRIAQGRRRKMRVKLG
jgi:hypothetical protein